MYGVTPYLLGLLGAILVILVIYITDAYLVRRLLPLRRHAYPASHSVASQRVLRVVEMIAAEPDRSDDQFVTALVQEGIAKVDAELMIRFVPTAFTWALLRKMGVSTFPSTFVVFDKKDRPVELPIANEHYFTSALLIATDVMAHGFTDRVSKPAFESIITRSAEMDAANKALAAHGDLSDATIGPPVLIGLAAEDLRAGRSAT